MSVKLCRVSRDATAEFKDIVDACVGGDRRWGWQTRAAARLGISRSDLSRYLNGRRLVTPSTVAACKMALGKPNAVALSASQPLGDAMSAVVAVLEPLRPEQRRRVIASVVALYAEAP